MKVVYLGPKEQRTVDLPCPLLSGKADTQVIMKRGVPTDIPDKYAEGLLAFPETFSKSAEKEMKHA